MHDVQGFANKVVALMKEHGIKTITPRDDTAIIGERPDGTDGFDNFNFVGSNEPQYGQ